MLSAAHPALQTLQSCRAAAGGWRGGGGGPGCLHHTGTAGGRGCCPTAPQLFKICFSGLEKPFFSVNSTSITQYLQTFAKFLLRIKICCSVASLKNRYFALVEPSQVRTFHLKGRAKTDHGISGILRNSDELVLQQAASFCNILNESKFVLNASWSLTWRRPPALTWHVGNCAVVLLSCIPAFLPLVHLC